MRNKMLVLCLLLCSCTSAGTLQPQTAAEVTDVMTDVHAAFQAAAAGILEFCSLVPTGDAKADQFCDVAPDAAQQVMDKINSLYGVLGVFVKSRQGPDAGKVVAAASDLHAAFVTSAGSVLSFCSQLTASDEAAAKFCSQAPDKATDLMRALNALGAVIQRMIVVGNSAVSTTPAKPTEKTVDICAITGNTGACVVGRE